MKKREAMSSKKLARKWPVPRHKMFEEQLRQSASTWFKEKRFSAHPRRSYCLKDWSDWKKNIILDEVSAYVEQVKNSCEKEGKPFPLHKYVHHGLSSEVLFSLEKSGIFILLSDERSPVFHCDVKGTNRGLMPFLLTLVPQKLGGRILSIGVQELVREIQAIGNHNDWINEFKRKYGLG